MNIEDSNNNYGRCWVYDITTRVSVSVFAEMLHITLVDGETLFDDSDRKMKMVVTKTMDGFLVYDAQLIFHEREYLLCIYRIQSTIEKIF